MADKNIVKNIINKNLTLVLLNLQQIGLFIQIVPYLEKVT